MANLNFVELTLTDEAVLNFGKAVYVLNHLKAKVTSYDEEREIKLGGNPLIDFFQFHDKFEFRVRAYSKCPLNDLYSDFFYYPLISKSRNSKYNEWLNMGELYALFTKHNRSNKVVWAIHNLIENLSNYYTVVTDIPNARDAELCIFDLYSEYKLLGAKFSEYSKVGYYPYINTRKQKRLLKLSKKKPILVLTLANPVLANDLKDHFFFGQCKTLTVFGGIL